jgi:hypothetical protein
MRYRNKKEWPKETSSKCLHCGGKIMHRPATIGISICNGEIKTKACFCLWSCVMAYCFETGLITDPLIMKLTEKIFQDMKKDPDEFDNPIQRRYLQTINSLINVWRSPPRFKFKRYGGGYTQKNLFDTLDKNINQVDRFDLPILTEP